MKHSRAKNIVVEVLSKDDSVMLCIEDDGLGFNVDDVGALTSFNDEDNVQQALQAGAISYLMKNVSIDELANAVKKAAQGVPTLSPEATRSLINASTRPPQLGYNLTSRELEVLALMAQGLNNREIGEKLFISAATVKNHVSNILDKLGTTSRTQAVALAVENKMV
jgi:two-component system, NarL family, response regulator LiaR